ncbi:hypothetical protein I79_008198 [Cricetulus griseus]|uniref:Secreted protein n=1 Tax=Cricetulus griseus TaxID=10029 RepID=G3HCI8_CRIGR|nr:hypothetical protein I79_008198 [Cricetulus griseus]
MFWQQALQCASGVWLMTLEHCVLEVSLMSCLVETGSSGIARAGVKGLASASAVMLEHCLGLEQLICSAVPSATGSTSHLTLTL